MMIQKINIRERLTLQFLLLVSILFLFFSASIYFFSELYLEKRFYKRLQDRAITTSTLFFDFQAENNTIMKIVDGTDKEYLTGEIVSIYEIQRNLFILTSDLTKEDFHRTFINKLDKAAAVNNLAIDGHKMTAVHIPDKGTDYWVLVSAIDKTGSEALTDLKNILFILALVALMFIGLLGWYFAAKAFSPISSIIEQTKEIFPKNLNKRIKHRNFEDEIGQLADTINKLLERVESSINTQKMFVANISHELKNPLTKIYTQIELLEMKYKTNTEFYEKIISLKEDTQHLNNLTHAILQLANMSSATDSIAMTKIRIDETLWDAITELKNWQPDIIIKVNLTDIPEDENNLMIYGNTDALKIVFKNLIDNACKFSNNQSAEVDLNFIGNEVSIAISNQGPIIPAQEIPKLFQPFYRINATAKGKSGHGVGLAIVNQIIVLHHGNIKVHSTAVGNVFTTSFKAL